MPPPGEGMKVLTYTMIGVAVSGVLFGIVRYFARGTPRTMTKEYQEATNEYLKVRRSLMRVMANQTCGWAEASHSNMPSLSL